MKSAITTCCLIFLILSCTQRVHTQTTTPPPTLFTLENSTRAAGVDSITRVRDPLPVVTLNNFSIDHRTRLTLFATNMDLLPGETISAITATARDSRSRNYSLKVEFLGKVPNLTSLSQLVVRLPDELAQAGDVSVSVSLHGQTSNEVLVNIEVQTQPRTATLPARRITNGHDNYVDSAFSFELGMNGTVAELLTRNDWDLQFGNNPNIDTFNVSMVGDDRSRIQDLGALNWGDTFQVPVLTPHPAPAIEPEVITVVGHMYVVHTKDTETDLYALFRVETLDPGKSVTISWKSVQSPE